MPQATMPIYALVATKDRWNLLTGTSLPSVRAQTRPPDLVILVNDGQAFSPDRQQVLAEVLRPIPLVVLDNCRAAGVAGAWNTGLAQIRASGSNGFVAILDDDDAWDACHLAENEAAARMNNTPIVVTGLRLVVDGVDHHRDFIQGLTDRHFLVGNPGWQGSNTFVRLSLLLQAGGFRDGLQSLNDRDLAIRLLRVSQTPPVLVRKWTSSWRIQTNGQSLSTPRSPAKLSGLRWFWRIYGDEMTEAETEAFFDRAANLFGIPRVHITEPTSDVPPHRQPHGDLVGN